MNAAEGMCAASQAALPLSMKYGPGFAVRRRTVVSKTRSALPSPARRSASASVEIRGYTYICSNERSDRWQSFLNWDAHSYDADADAGGGPILAVVHHDTAAA